MTGHLSTPVRAALRLRALAFVCAAAIVLAGSTAAHAARAISIKKLVEQKSKWPSFAASGLPMSLEGRYSIFSSKLLRFLKCDDLNFVWHEDDVPFPIDVAALHSRTIEVHGRFALQGDKPFFRVERVNELPSDEETLRVRRIAMADSPAPAWYALGEWSLDCATFYGDLGLEAEARFLDAEGIARAGNAHRQRSRCEDRSLAEVHQIWPPRPGPPGLPVRRLSPTLAPGQALDALRRQLGTAFRPDGQELHAPHAARSTLARLGRALFAASRRPFTGN